MNKDILRRQLGNIVKLNSEGKLLDAIIMLNQIAGQINSPEILSETEKLLDRYTALLRFMSSGIIDREFSITFDSLSSDSLALAMRISRHIAMPDSSELYFSTARSLHSDNSGGISSYVNQYIQEIHRLENDFDSISDPDRTLKAEAIVRHLFNLIWTTHPLTNEDYEAIDRLMQSDIPNSVRASIISSIGLGHRSYYDAHRLAWLLKTYITENANEPELALRALVEAMISLFRYSRRPLSSSEKNTLIAASEESSWDKDMTMIAIELVRAFDSDKLTAKLHDGFLNEFNKLDSELRGKLQRGEIGLEDITADFNPEWDESGENSFSKHMKEFAEIQAEGGDVFLGSFSQMKKFPFFHELPNWFLPFYGSYSAVSSTDSEEGILSTLLSKMPILCDNDKYSLIFSLSQIPSAQRAQLESALRIQSEQMADNLSEFEKASGIAIRRNIINKYIQNLYRFHSLFRNKSDFYNVFGDKTKVPNLLEVPSLKGFPSDPELLDTIANFYFKSKHWSAAAEAFKSLDKLDLPTASRAQKEGYALERAGNDTEALSCYEEAEMLSNESEWTLKHIASLLYKMCNFKSASQYFVRLSDSFPENNEYSLKAAQSLAYSNQFEQAELYFHKLLYNTPDDSGALRGLAEVLIKIGKFDAAWEAINKIQATELTAHDYLLMGILELSGNNIPSAINYFNQFCDLSLSELAEKDVVDFLHKHLLSFNDILSSFSFDDEKLKILLESIRFIRKQ